MRDKFMLLNAEYLKPENKAADIFINIQSTLGTWEYKY